MTTASHEGAYARLSSLLDRWRSTGAEPDEAGGLSGGEWRALALAAGHNLRDPIGDFMILDKWLQVWVLRQLNLGHMVGWRVGID